jgi:hypothetical protein
MNAETLEKEWKKAADDIDTRVERLWAEGVEVTGQVVLDNSPSNRVLHFAAEHDEDGGAVKSEPKIPWTVSTHFGTVRPVFPRKRTRSPLCRMARILQIPGVSEASIREGYPWLDATPVETSMNAASR